MEKYLYIIKFNNLYKIGWSKNPSNRIKQLTLGPSAEIIFEKPFPNISKVEKNLHHLFEEKKVSGEWFELSEEDIEQIESMSFSDLLSVDN